MENKIILCPKNGLDNLVKDLIKQDECIILFHISTGDIFTSYPIVMEYLDKYDKIHIYTLYRNRLTTKQLYENFAKIEIHELPNDYNKCVVPNHIYNNLVTKNTKLIKLGWHDENFSYNPKKDINFWKVFYQQASLDYTIKFKHINIKRNFKREEFLYNMIKNKYGEKYIFTHDHRSYDYKHYDVRRNVYVKKNKDNLPVFHPNINYYDDDTEHKYYNYWPKFVFNNLLDYCLILEKASEIHITDSCFSCLATYLDLSNVKKKYIYTTYDLIDYDPCYKDWNIILS